MELSCETDFVAKNEDFQKLAYDIAMHVAAANPEFIREDEITEDVKKKRRIFLRKKWQVQESRRTYERK